jgi:uncharacterized protein
MSLVPTAVSSNIEVSVTPSSSTHASPRGDNKLTTTPRSTPQNNKELLAIDASPLSKFRLFNRNSPISPLVAAKWLAPHSPLTSPYTEPRFRVPSSAGNPINISSVGASLVTTLNEAALLGDVDAQFNLAMSYSFGKGVDQNLEKALDWFLKCAQKDDAKAKYYVGVMYLNGHGTEVDMEKAADWFMKSANQGDADAQCDLGIMYLQGRGVDRIETEAVSYFQKAAEQGHADAQLNLAVCYENGEGVEKDLAKAIILYCKAAEQGNSDAQIQLEYLFTEGLSTEKEKVDTFVWYQKEAAKNLKFAQKVLVKAYSLGIGVTQDLKMATYWVLRSGLKNDFEIRVSEKNYDLIKFIPDAFNTFPEFSKIEKIEFEKGYLSNENIISICELIHSNKSIELLNLTDIALENSDALNLIEALKVNSTVTDLFFDGTNINNSLINEIQKLLDQNDAISEARKYAKNHPIILSSAMSNDGINNSIEKIVISNLKSGLNLNETKQAINEFLEKIIQIPVENSSEKLS